ncbi:MAG: T9SS type A sorting domain-containing protein, partial [Bacteroidota bacterium]
VVGSAGTYFSDVNAGDLHWTIGEVAISYFENGTTLAEGFHQTYFDLVVTSIFEASELNLRLDVFPNPTVGQLTVTGDWNRGDRIQMVDLLGRPLLEKELNPEREEFQMSSYPAGTYILSILREGRPLKTFRVIKQ